MNNETKFTKGEWRVADYLDKETGARSLAVWVGMEKTICLVSPKGSETEEDYENAKLIAAAPDLLNALQKMLKLIDDGVLVRNIKNDGDKDWAIRQVKLVAELNVAMDAIKKATS